MNAPPKLGDIKLKVPIPLVDNVLRSYKLTVMILPHLVCLFLVKSPCRGGRKSFTFSGIYKVKWAGAFYFVSSIIYLIIPHDSKVVAASFF